MGKRTPLYDQHVNMGGKMVDFAGWDMPINYGSQIEEHHQVRNDAGMFDVSHMTVIDLSGAEVSNFLRKLLANDVARLKDEGKALYSCMLKPEGGVIDDLIVYYMKPDWYRLVVNSATREKDLAWINEQAESFQVDVNERPDTAMIAVQGPQAKSRLKQVLNQDAANLLDDIKVFFARELGDYFIGRTGYTGEDGYEIILPADQASALWQQLQQAGVKPIGLGARDTLRLEAGMNLYGTDMDESISPLEAGLGWTIAWDPTERDFIGRTALEKQRQDKVTRKLVGLVLLDKGVLRNHQKIIIEGVGEGEITSGSFSPTLGKAIAFARVPVGIGDACQVEVRGRQLNARVVKLPFVRHGKSCLPEDL